MMQALRDEIGACLTAFAPEGEHEAQVAWVFPRTFTGFRGHFPGQPIFPGVCLVAAQLEAARRLAGRRLELLEMENVKFMWAVFPEREVGGRLRVVPMGGGRWRVQAELRRGERRIAKFLLLAREKEDGGEM